MLRISHDCLCFEGCERHRIVVSPFLEVCVHQKSRTKPRVQTMTDARTRDGTHDLSNLSRTPPKVVAMLPLAILCSWSALT